MDFGAASRPCAGFMRNGDAYYSREVEQGCLVAVIDGLGRGSEAAEASSIAVKCLTASSTDLIPSFYRICHEKLLGTRGVAAGIAIVDQSRDVVEFGGVGNIEALVWTDEGVTSFVSTFGVVGSGPAPPVKTRKAGFPPGAVLIMHSDGVSSAFRLADYYGLMDQSAQFIADALMRDWGKTNDDATVVVLRRESE